MRTLVLICMILVSGCAHYRLNKLQEDMNTHIGEDINVTIMRKGPPTKVFQMPNGNTMYTWSRSATSSTVTQYSRQIADMDTQTYTCNVTYITGPDHKIIAAKASGNGC